jgi:Protein of unknown function (DUF2380)
MGHWNTTNFAMILVGALATSTSVHAKDFPTVAFFGFSLINTSLEPTKPVEEARLRMLDSLLQEQLRASGRFAFVAVPPDLREKIAAGPRIGNCNGCERVYAMMIDADWAAWGTVQKVSNLILNINFYMENVKTGNFEFARSIDIRGNTDESWQRGLDYMLRNYFINER